jgi:hypothetical protein
MNQEIPSIYIGGETTEQETQGKTSNPMDNHQETKEKILRVMTGALSVLSYLPMPLYIQNTRPSRF